MARFPYNETMTEFEKMVAGKIYDCSDPDLHGLQKKLNALNEEWNLLPSSSPRKQSLLREFAPHIHPTSSIRSPAYFDYGCNVYMDENSYTNFGFTALDVCPIYIGKSVHIGSNVSMVTPLHPLDPEDRKNYVNDRGDVTDLEYGAPIHVGDHCWIASNVIICPGVTIGEGSVIGAGSVVTKDIPAGVIAVGNPCRVLREIGEKDKLKYHPELFAKE